MKNDSLISYFELKFLIGLIFCVLALNNPAQSYFCAGLDTTGSAQAAAAGCVSSLANSTAYVNYYGKLSTYLPTPNDSVLTVNITFHIATASVPAEYTGEFANSTSTVNGLPRLLHLLSGMTEGHYDRYSAQPQCTYPTTVHTFQYDSRIQYHVTNIYFYHNTTLDTSRNYSLKSYISSNYPARLDEGIPIYIYRGAYAHTDAGPAIHTAVTLGDSASFRGQLLHELGHCFELKHPYASPYKETIDCNNIDFLADLFPLNDPTCQYRPTDTLGGGPGANFDCNCSCGACYETWNYSTNNFMGEGQFYPRNWMSPLQMARRRKALHFSPVRKYVKDVVSDRINPLVVNADETWDFDIQLYRDIIVKSGHKLTIKCKVSMAKKGKIVVEKGAQLFLDGGTVTGWCKTGLWDGIELEGTPNKKQRLNSSGFCPDHAVLKINGA